MTLQNLITVDLFYFITCENPTWIETHWNNIVLRAQSHITSEYTWEPVTTLHDFGSDLGRPLDTFFWALTISWARLLARVWQQDLSKWMPTMHRIMLKNLSPIWGICIGLNVGICMPTITNPWAEILADTHPYDSKELIMWYHINASLPPFDFQFFSAAVIWVLGCYWLSPLLLLHHPASIGSTAGGWLFALRKNVTSVL